MGRFEIANKGTLFLDEIGDLSFEMQTKLLQVLENYTFERVGESSSINVDVRLITATNMNIADAISQKRLRTDLFYRIAVAPILLPPLRERLDDIPLLIHYFSKELAKNTFKKPLSISNSMMKLLTSYPWPGNVREVRNVVNRLFIQQNIYQGFGREDIQEILNMGWIEKDTNSVPDILQTPQKPLCTLHEVERQHIFAVLKHCNGTLSGPHGAAKVLGMPRSTLQHKIHKLGLIAKKE